MSFKPMRKPKLPKRKKYKDWITVYDNSLAAILNAVPPEIDPKDIDVSLDYEDNTIELLFERWESDEELDRRVLKYHDKLAAYETWAEANKENLAVYEKKKITSKELAAKKLEFQIAETENRLKKLKEKRKV